MDTVTLDEARTGRREAVIAVMAEHLPEVWRIAVNLAGTEARGREVVRRVMEQAQLAMPQWEHVDAPPRWFRHHTILAVRQQTATSPGKSDALLVNVSPAFQAAAAYRALVTALRKLPHQQREAFLLNHGEAFTDRQLGIAMDCSVEAAATHLRGAHEVLRPLAGKEYGTLIARLVDAYRSAIPPDNVAVRYRKRWMKPEWRRRLVAAGLFIAWALVLLIGVLIVIGVFVLRDRVEI